MPIVEARAIPYNEMVNLVTGKPVNFFGKVPVIPQEKLWMISITDPETPPIFACDSANVINLKFKDIDPQNIDFVPPPDNIDYMRPEQARKIVDFLKMAHADPMKSLLVVNCHQGWCRSGAIVDFVGTVFGLGFYAMRDRNPQMLPNHWVRYLLFQEWFKQKYQPDVSLQP
jgi:hypothetical protein